MDLSAVAAYKPSGFSVMVGCCHDKGELGELAFTHYASYLSNPMRDGFNELKELGGWGGEELGEWPSW